MTETIFDKIIRRELPAEIVYEDDNCLGFRDINPQSPVHILIIPKKRIPSIAKATDTDGYLLGQLLLVARSIAKSEGVDQTGYRLTINCGEDGGQTVDHLHIHLMGGKDLN